MPFGVRIVLAPVFAALIIAGAFVGTAATAGLVPTEGATEATSGACASGLAAAGAAMIAAGCDGASIFGACVTFTLAVEAREIGALDIDGRTGELVATGATNLGELVDTVVVDRTTFGSLGVVSVGVIAIVDDATAGAAAAFFATLTLSDGIGFDGAVCAEAATCAGSAFFGSVKFETVEGRSSNIIPSPDFRFFSLTTGAAATALGSGIC
jgi:hypothetical protein